MRRRYLDSDDGAEDGLLGFMDDHGRWATVDQLEAEFGDQLDNPVRQALERLVEIGMMRVRRNKAGRIVEAQLSPFAADLYAADGDDEALAVYIEYGREPPESLREEYVTRLRARKGGAGR